MNPETVAGITANWEDLDIKSKDKPNILFDALKKIGLDEMLRSPEEQIKDGWNEINDAMGKLCNAWGSSHENAIRYPWLNEREEIKEGNSKGGINGPPTVPRPEIRPKGQGGC